MLLLVWLLVIASVWFSPAVAAVRSLPSAPSHLSDDVDTRNVSTDDGQLAVNSERRHRKRSRVFSHHSGCFFM